MRLRIILNMEFMPLKGVARYSQGKTRNFSCDGLSFASDSVVSEPEVPVMVKFKLPSDYMDIYALGDIIWKRQVANKHLAGVKIREVDKESKSKKLGFPFNMWLEDIRDKN